MDRITGIPRGVVVARYKIRPPLVKRSGITGWAINYAVGCTHACPFCYVDSIHRRYPRRGLEDLIAGNRWGQYLAIPSNLWEAIRQTPWWRWRGRDVFMSSSHDPYMPPLAVWARRILERALPAGINVILHTRSILYKRDLDLLERYKDNLRIHASIATLSRLYKVLEPRAPPPRVRIKVLKEAGARGIRVGASVSPILPPNRFNRDVYEDLLEIAGLLAEAGVYIVYGEPLHPRGLNLELLREVLGDLRLRGWDRVAEKLFTQAMEEYGLNAVWLG
ncbi:MAG: radical SAM protein [Desulfurococcales archaeon]|nr:radical SAM protein [Desulfurococcales archaeon]